MPETIVGPLVMQDLVGKTDEEAALLLENDYLTYIADPGGATSGTVLSQFPAAGADVDPGTVVTLFFYVPLVEITVRATQNGFFGGLYRYAGDTFDITDPMEYSPYWMELIDTPPPEWISSLQVFVPYIDREMLEF